MPDEPVIKRAQDSTPLAPVSPAAGDTSASPSTAGVAPGKAGKRNLIQRVFGGGPKATNAPAPKPPVEPPPPRYTYRRPGKLVSGNRSQAERLFTQGIQAYQAHRSSEAIQAYRQAAQVDPTYFEAQYNLGLAAAEAGKLPLALLAYDTALAIRPESTDARYNFALVLQQANYTLDAANELEKLLTSDPQQVRAQMALANLYSQQLRQPAKARDHYRQVLELDPHNPQAAAIRAWLLQNP